MKMMKVGKTGAAKNNTKYSEDDSTKIWKGYQNYFMSDSAKVRQFVD